MRINFFKAIYGGFKKVVVRVGLVLSVALTVMSVACAFFVPTKLLGVPIAAIGCFAAGWMFSVFMSKTKADSGVYENAELLKAAKEENVRLGSEIAALRQENKRLEGQRIDVNALAPVLKLGLVEADMKVKDVKRAWMNDFSEGIPYLIDPRRSQYVGVLQRSFKVTYGVDLARVRILDDGDCLHVAGITPESLGFKDDESIWLVRQIEKYCLKSTSETEGCAMPVISAESGFKMLDKSYEIDRNKPFEGSVDLNSTDEMAKTQERELRERINNGVGEEFRNINGYIRGMAEGFVKILLSPVKKPVVFSKDSLSQISDKVGWVSIEEYAKNYNKQLDMQCSQVKLEM